MPGAQGLELLRALRELDPTACVIICSGAGDSDMRTEAKLLGAAEWVLKPVYTSALVSLLRDVVAASHLRRSERTTH
jgi:FixJ family two-component response regulator